MAKFWVGGTGNTSDATNHWATSSGGSPGAGNTPTAADDLFFDALSGAGTTTIDAALAGRSIQSAGSSVTALIHNASVTITIGDATAGAGNKALDFSGFSTYTLGSNTTSNITFISTSATVQTVNFNNLGTGSVTYNASSNGSWKLTGTHQQPFVASIGSLVTLTKGTLDLNSQACNWNGFASSNSNVRTLLPNGTTIACSSNGTVWNCATSTNMTYTTNGEVITLANGNACTFAGGGLTYGTLNRATTGGSGTSITITGSNSFAAIIGTSSNAARSYLFTAGTTTTIRTKNGFGIVGTSGKLATIDSATAATHTLTSSGGLQSTDFLSVNHSIVDASPGWYAGTHSTDGGTNTNWIFTTTPSIALSGTITSATTVKDIVAGGKTIILTLTNETWVASGATFNAQRQNIINGLTSNQSYLHGWNNEVKAKIGVTDVVQTSSTVVTITLDAEAGYALGDGQVETITATVPATALTHGTSFIASPAFTVSPANNFHVMGDEGMTN